MACAWRVEGSRWRWLSSNVGGCVVIAPGLGAIVGCVVIAPRLGAVGGCVTMVPGLPGLGAAAGCVMVVPWLITDKSNKPKDTKKEKWQAITCHSIPRHNSVQIKRYTIAMRHVWKHLLYLISLINTVSFILAQFVHRRISCVDDSCHSFLPRHFCNCLQHPCYNKRAQWRGLQNSSTLCQNYPI